MNERIVGALAAIEECACQRAGMEAENKKNEIYEETPIYTESHFAAISKVMMSNVHYFTQG